MVLEGLDAASRAGQLRKRNLPATTPAALKPKSPRTMGAKTGVKTTPVTAPAAA
jgi:hypothetical protein